MLFRSEDRSHPNPQHLALAETAAQRLERDDYNSESQSDHGRVDRRGDTAMRRRGDRLIAEHLSVHVRFELSAFRSNSGDEIERFLRTGQWPFREQRVHFWCGRRGL